eukprot:Gb_38860 [translate_table: standard]
MGSYHEFANLHLSENDTGKKSQMDPEVRNWHEHKHECGGMSWAAVLPTEVVLAGRIFIKSIEKKTSFGHSQEHSINMSLCHHYEKMQPGDKLELHILSIVLAYCLQSAYSEVFQLSGSSTSKLLLLIAQVKVNAMAIVHMSSPDSAVKPRYLRRPTIADSVTCSIEQVQVAQAVYLRGSVFNHSCEPNVHALFISRSLLVHSVKHIPAGSSLELCYGPQVGEAGLEDRQTWLEKRYFFTCKCSGCSELNLSDIVLSSFRCAKHECQGAVMDKAATKLQTLVGTGFKTYVNFFSRDVALPVDEQKKQSINEVAYLLVTPENGGIRQINPGHCLNCGSACDVETTHKVASESLQCLKRVQNEIYLLTSTGGETKSLLLDAL